MTTGLLGFGLTAASVLLLLGCALQPGAAQTPQMVKDIRPGAASSINKSERRTNWPDRTN